VFAYDLKDLLLLLQKDAPAKVDAITLHRREVEDGLLSVGLKIHCLGDRDRFSRLVDGLGGSERILAINRFKQVHASLCLVLPPVGNARSAVLLLEAIGQFVGFEIFDNCEVQLQVCSPGRLDARRSAMLAIGFYLGSDTLRRYRLGDFSTSFSTDDRYSRGQRLVLYDAGGFDRNFEWWKGLGTHRVIEAQLPFTGRSDLLVGSASRLDIENINLLATLLVHAQYHGYWRDLGKQFEAEMEGLLDKHLLAGLIAAPWVWTDEPDTHDDQKFFSALQELVAYAFEEAVRIKVKKPGHLFRSWKELPARSSCGILQEVHSMLNRYRGELVSQSRTLS